jgi:hypothetical protein
MVADQIFSFIFSGTWVPRFTHPFWRKLVYNLNWYSQGTNGTKKGFPVGKQRCELFASLCSPPNWLVAAIRGESYLHLCAHTTVYDSFCSSSPLEPIIYTYGVLWYCHWMPSYHAFTPGSNTAETSCRLPCLKRKGMPYCFLVESSNSMFQRVARSLNWRTADSTLPADNHFGQV